MDELLAQLSQDGFSIPQLELTGKLSRFDRAGKKTGWIIAFENKTKNDETYIVAVYGDWKTGEKYEFKSKREYTKSQNAEILKRIADAQRESEREREELQANAKREAQDLWDSAGENARIDYMARKGIPSLFGCRSTLGADGRVLLVPMRDSSGELWGVQQIHPNGNKYFLTGQRIEGCFHVIPTGSTEVLLDVIYIAEGFATACSIHQATQRPVVVAFNAGNLVHVAKELKNKFPTSNFIICGDDDQFTERDGEKYNPGVICAEKAAKLVSGKAIFPKFSSIESKPTDFNDLHLLEGLEAVKTQVLGAPDVEKQYVLCLGFHGDKYYYTSSQNNYIKCVTAMNHSKNNLLSLIGLNYWQSTYPSKNDDEVDWTQAYDDLMTKCRRKGSFNQNNVRATGAWLGEDKKLVLNTGNYLIVGGQKKGFHSVKSRYIYEPGDATLPEPSSEFLSNFEGENFLETLYMLRWAHKDYYKFLAGWLMVAPICGTLEWRPHCWLTGPSGSGKSTIMQEIIYRLLVGKAGFFQGPTTEAGIRQSIGKKALPVIIDELETNHDDKSGQRVGSVIELCRQASSETDASVVKGSASGDSISYVTRFAAFVSSINVNLPNEADKTRFTTLELLRGGENQKELVSHFQGFKKRLAVIDDRWVQAYYSRPFALFDVFRHNRELLFTEIAEQYNSRLAQQYSVLLSGYHLWNNSRPISKDEAKSIVKDVDLEFKSKEVEESDELECLRFILSKKFYINGPISQDTTIYEMIRESNAVGYNQTPWIDSLRRMGIVIKDGYLCIVNNHTEINSILKGTKWVGLYSRTLLRVKNADNNANKPIWINGASSKVVRIPLEQILVSS